MLKSNQNKRIPTEYSARQEMLPLILLIEPFQLLQYLTKHALSISLEKMTGLSENDIIYHFASRLQVVSLKKQKRFSRLRKRLTRSGYNSFFQIHAARMKNKQKSLPEQLYLNLRPVYYYSSCGFNTPLLAANPHRECFCVQLDSEPCTVGRNTVRLASRIAGPEAKTLFCPKA